MTFFLTLLAFGTLAIILAAKINWWPDPIFIVLASILGLISVVLPPYIIPNGIITTCDGPFPLILVDKSRFFPYHHLIIY